VRLFDKIISNRREIGGDKRDLGGRGGTVCNSTRARDDHCLRCGGRFGVGLFYRVTLLVSAVLTQLIPIICGVGCIKTTDTKDNHLQHRLH
jgi:hypothetical protein